MAKQTKSRSTTTETGKRNSRTPASANTSTTKSASATSVAEPKTTPKKKPSASQKNQKQPTREQIQARAYEVFLRRAGRPGDERSDWLQAERELVEELNRA
jgi:hypothetical protein